MKKIITVLIVILALASCTRKDWRDYENYRGDQRETSRVYADPEKRLVDMHRFQDTYQKIQSQKASLLSRINTGETYKDIQPEIMIINNWIGEFNAQSRDYDRALWKSANLPESLSLISSVDDLSK